MESFYSWDHQAYSILGFWSNYSQSVLSSFSSSHLLLFTMRLDCSCWDQVTSCLDSVKDWSAHLVSNLSLVSRTSYSIATLCALSTWTRSCIQWFHLGCWEWCFLVCRNLWSHIVSQTFLRYKRLEWLNRQMEISSFEWILQSVDR